MRQRVLVAVLNDPEGDTVHVYTEQDHHTLDVALDDVGVSVWWEGDEGRVRMVYPWWNVAYVQVGV